VNTGRLLSVNGMQNAAKREQRRGGFPLCFVAFSCLILLHVGNEKASVTLCVLNGFLKPLL
jgi:hypothetical protein